MSWYRTAVHWRVFALRGIPALPAGGAHIRVTFQVDADRLLSVTAMEKSTGVEASIQVKPSYGLTDSEITSMIKDSMSYASRTLKLVCWQNRKWKRRAYWKV